MISWFFSLYDREGNAYYATCSASYFALRLSLAAGLFEGTPTGMALRLVDR